ncbi:MAG: hypothetical protein IH607_01050 [Firmicutes bacterium]|nr:hypothetical protein [Bacillota bacterium]
MWYNQGIHPIHCTTFKEGQLKMREETRSAFEDFTLSLSSAEAEALSAFFEDYAHHNFLHAREKAQMRVDFENAILQYRARGVSLSEALRRLAVCNLGSFYARPSLRWFPLDNAAKIYPFSMAHGRMAVFRLSVYMTEAIIPDILQIALSFTIKRFPSFATTVKKGFFWHYLDTSKRRYSLEPEESMPCKPLKVARSGSQSFRVIYYQNRVSIEFFHVLADGSGGMVFLKTLMTEYLRLLGFEAGQDGGALDINDTPSQRELADAFAMVPRTEKSSGFVSRPAVQMSGKLCRQKPCRVLHFKMDGGALRAAAKQYDATVTSYLLALIFIACKHATDETRGMMRVQVPVNMRKFYPSKTLRNFSMYCGIQLPIQTIADVRSITGEITAQLSEKASRHAMSEMVTAAARIVSSLRFIPLFIKTPAVKLVNGILSDRLFSTTLSNLGVVHMPPELTKHVESMDVVMGPSATNRAACSLVTFGNGSTLSITKSTADPSFEETLYDLLTADSVSLAVEGSALYED